MKQRHTGGLVVLLMLMSISVGAAFELPARAQAQPATGTANLTSTTALAGTEPRFEYDVDRPGSDLFYVEFGDGEVEGNAEVCEQTCRIYEACRAWTLVRPGVQNPRSRCYLKSAVPAPVTGAPFAISGVVRPDGAAAPPVPGTTPVPVPPQTGTGATTTAAGCQGFSGTWSDNVFGTLSLIQSGDSVSGSYSGGQTGVVEGRITGKSLDATWVHRDGRSGTVRIDLTGDGSTYQGEASTTGWGNAVRGTCVGPPPPA